MNNPITRLFRYLRGTSVQVVAPAPSKLPVLATPTIVAAPQKSTQLIVALQGLNDEFSLLNSKLVELRDALEHLRDALKQLEAANQRRALQKHLLTAPNRSDLN